MTGRAGSRPPETTGRAGTTRLSCNQTACENQRVSPVSVAPARTWRILCRDAVGGRAKPERVMAERRVLEIQDKLHRLG